MASQYADFGITAVDRTAASQMLATVKAVYADNLDAIAPMLLPSGGIVARHVESSTWPPSYVIIESSPGDYLIVMEGTTQPIAQGLWHAFGSFAYSETDGSVVNGQWNAVADTVVAAMLAVSGTMPTGVKWRISGHSYGGAVAQLVGERLVNQFPAWDVSLLTIGQPRARGTGYLGRHPSPYWRLDSTGDPVPLIPPAGRYPAITPDLRSWLQLLPNVSWTQYGSEQVLGQTGGINAGIVIPPDGLPEDITDSPLAAHGTQNYWARLKWFAERNPATPAQIQAINVYAGLIGAQELPQPPGLPTFVSPTVENPQYRAPSIYPPPDPLPETAMAPQYLALADGGGTLFKVVAKMNITDPGGESETMYLWYGSPTVPIEIWQNALIYLSANRRSILTRQATLRSWTISRVLPTKGKGRLWKGNPPVGLGAGNVTGNRVVGNNCATWTMYDTSDTFHAIYTTRFLPAEYAQMTPTQTPETVAFNPNLLAWRDALISGFTGLNNITQFGLVGALRVIDQRTDTNLRYTIRAYYYIDGALNIEVDGGISGAVRGSKVVLRHSAQKCITGLTGQATILGFAPGTITGTTRYVLNKGYCCPAETLVKAIGTVQLLRYGAVPWGSMVDNALSTRNTGRPSGSRRGRQQAKCC